MQSIKKKYPITHIYRSNIHKKIQYNRYKYKRLKCWFYFINFNLPLCTCRGLTEFVALVESLCDFFSFMYKSLELELIGADVFPRLLETELWLVLPDEETLIKKI